MDRLNPRFFNVDYWPLVEIRRAMDTLFENFGSSLRGGTALDFGAVQSPYAPRFASLGIKLLMADIGDVPPGVLKISDDGRLPVDNESMDLVLSTQVLEHVPEVRAYLIEAVRVLKPGGILFLTTHGTWHLHRVPTDMRRWTIDGLRYDIEKAGFFVESVKPHVGRLATCTYQRMVAISELLRRLPPLSPLRAINHIIGNTRMAIEEFVTSPAGRESLQQILVVTARKPH